MNRCLNTLLVKPGYFVGGCSIKNTVFFLVERKTVISPSFCDMTVLSTGVSMRSNVEGRGCDDIIR